MKNLTLLKNSKIEISVAYGIEHKLVAITCMIISQVIMSLTIHLLPFKSFLQSIFLDNYSPIWFILIAIGSMVILGIILTFIAFRLGVAKDLRVYLDKKVAAAKKRRQEAREKLEQEFQESKAKLKEGLLAAKQGVRTTYTVDSWKPSQKPLAIICKLSMEIYENLLPIVTLNGITLAVNQLDSNSLEIFLEKGISTTSEKMELIVGGSVSLIDNPYLLKPNGGTIKWQCVGHAHDRKIIFSSNHFPFAAPGLLYPFTLYVGGKRIEEFVGTYCPTEKALVVPIKSFHKSQCAGKLVTLRTDFGKATTFSLPEPTVMKMN